MRRRVVVTGIGVIAPNGTGKESFLAALRAGQSGVRYVDALRDAGFECQVAGVPSGFEFHAKNYFDELELRALDRTAAYASVAAMDCWTDSGFCMPEPDNGEVHWDTGVVCGSGLPGLQTISEVLVPRVNERLIRRLGGTVVQRSMASSAPAVISGLLGLGGPSFTVSNACASGTQAIALGFDAVVSGLCTRMMVGGADTDSAYAWAGFDAMKLLARGFNDVPLRASRPLSASSRGFVPGAGGCFLMLEDFASAVGRAAPIYAEICGVATNAGGQRNGGTMTAANRGGMERCISQALVS